MGPCSWAAVRADCVPADRVEHRHSSRCGNDPYNPDWLQLGDDFIFLTTNYVVTDNGHFAFLAGYPSAGGCDNCGSVEVKVRSAFAKIDEDDTTELKAYWTANNYADDGDVIGM